MQIHTGSILDENCAGWNMFFLANLIWKLKFIGQVSSSFLSVKTQEVTREELSEKQSLAAL